MKILLLQSKDDKSYLPKQCFLTEVAAGMHEGGWIRIFIATQLGKEHTKQSHLNAHIEKRKGNRGRDFYLLLYNLKIKCWGNG